jgi:SNF2 family DNA or RNA helicase
MNNTFDLYAQVEFIIPGLLGSPEFFAREYANPIDKDGNQEKIATLSRITAPFILRRTKKQVAPDLPEKTESVLWCEMEDRQRADYEETKKSIRDNIFLNIKNDGLAKSKIGILAGIIKLRQICCAPSLVDDFKDCPPEDSIKLGVLMEELNTLQSSSKALVFSQFKGMLHLIASSLNQSGIPYYHFDGDTPITDRQAMVNAFQTENDPAKVFLISLKAGNTGLNLTAADYVFLVDPWWNTAIQQQAIDRTHRIGQNNRVFAYKMICKNTIEERILQLQAKKQWISDELIHAEDGFVKNLSEDDVEFLFS